MRCRCWLNLPVALLFVMVSLAFTGLVSRTAEVHGVARTAHVDFEWFFRSCDDNVATNSKATWHTLRDSGDKRNLLVQIQDGYPGLTVYCEAHFVNTGTTPIRITGFTTTNSNPGALDLMIREDPDDKPGHVVQPCTGVPAWGTRPSLVKATCRQEVQFSVTVLNGYNGYATFSHRIHIAQAT
jgi:hypothetical protein